MIEGDTERKIEIELSDRIPELTEGMSLLKVFTLVLEHIKTLEKWIVKERRINKELRAKVKHE